MIAVIIDRTTTYRLGSLQLLARWAIPNQFTWSCNDVVERITAFFRCLGLLVLADELNNLVLLNKHLPARLSNSHLLDHVGDHGGWTLGVPCK